MAQISKADLEKVKTAISDAEHGQATLEQLAHAHAIAERAGGGRTVGILRTHIRRMTPDPTSSVTLRNFITGLASGCVVWLLLGRRGRVEIFRRRVA
jgi:hypothetical protein